MTNYTLHILFLLNIVLISCNTESTLSKADNKKDGIETQLDSISTQENDITKVLPETDSIPAALNIIYKKFYNAICYDLSDPRPILNEHGYYVLDMKTYKNELSSSNLFTNSFIERQDEIFSECINALERDSITPQDVPDGIDVSAPFGCGFFHYNYYLGSQERPDGFFLRNSKMNESSGFTEVHYYTTVEDSFFTWDSQIILRVDVKKEKEEWKINNVKKLVK